MVEKSFRFRDPEWFKGLPQSEKEVIRSDIRKDNVVFKKWVVILIASLVYGSSVLLIGMGSREFFEMIGLGIKETQNNYFVLPWVALGILLFLYIRTAVLNHPYYILAGLLKLDDE